MSKKSEEKEVHESMRRVYDATGCKDANSLSKAMNLPSQNFYNWDSRGISHGGALLISEHFKIDMTWILTGNGAAHKQTPKDGQSIEDIETDVIDDWDDSTPVELDEVPVIFYKDLKFSCGSGSLSEALSSEKRRLRISRLTLDRNGIYKDRIFATTAKDNSMLPEIKDGDTIYIDQNRNYIKDERIFAIEHGGLFRCKRLYTLPNGGVRIVSDNKDEYPEEILTAEQIIEQKFRVIGFVFKVDRMNRW